MMCACACESVLVLLQGVCISVLLLCRLLRYDGRAVTGGRQKKRRERQKSNTVTGRRGVGCKSSEVVNWKRAS
jgi:hypothetical protein